MTDKRSPAALDFPNPKVGPTSEPVDSWYRYYAGYSSPFVDYTLGTLAPRAKSILDPWNGTGTTTVLAASRRIKAFGYDINPALVVVARGPPPRCRRDGQHQRSYHRHHRTRPTCPPARRSTAFLAQSYGCRSRTWAPDECASATG